MGESRVVPFPGRMRLRRAQLEVRWLTGPEGGGEPAPGVACRITHLPSGLSAVSPGRSDPGATLRAAYRALFRRLLEHHHPPARTPGPHDEPGRRGQPPAQARHERDG